MALAELDDRRAAAAPPSWTVRLGLALLPPAVATFTFLPITRNYFADDDFLHLLTLANNGLWQFLVAPFGGHMLIVRNLAFALCVAAFGTQPAGYFWTVLATHVANVCLLYVLLVRFTSSRPIASLVALLWGSMPHYAVALGWYSVYGEMLCATLVLIVMLDVVRVADRAQPIAFGRAATWSLLMIGAATCFGIGIGVAVVFPLAATLYVGRARYTAAGRRVLWAMPVVVAIAYVLIQRSGMVSGIPFLKAVVLLALAGLPVFAMWWHLVAYGAYALTLGPFVSPRFFVTPPGMAIAGGLVAALAATIATADPPLRRRLLAFALLAIGGYGVIAAGRAALYSPALGTTVLRGSLEGRYHYVSQLFVGVVLAHGLLRLGRRLTPPLRSTAFVSTMATILVGFLMHRPAIDHHDEARAGTVEALARIEADAAAARAAAPSASSITIENRPFAPMRLPDFVGTAGLFVIWYPTDVLEDRRVFFAAAPRAWQAAQERGGRLAALVRPSMAPPGP